MIKLKDDKHIISVLQNFSKLGENLTFNENTPIQILSQQHKIVAKYNPTINIPTNGDKSVTELNKLVTVFNSGFLDPAIEFKDDCLYINETADNATASEVKYLYAHEELVFTKIPNVSDEATDFIEINVNQDEIKRITTVASAMSLTDVELEYDGNGHLRLSITKSKDNNSNMASNTVNYDFDIIGGGGDMPKFNEYINVNVMFTYLHQDDYTLRVKMHKHNNGEYHPICVFTGDTTGIQYFIPFKAS